ncbi:MAG: 2-amino-4-hydroxy-6-hydroxymethyldihydropteridine diphosphokinase [Pseudomonadota bacterium]
MSKNRSFALIALGANLTSPVGTPILTLRKAMKSLHYNAGVIRSVSRFFRTPCFPAGAGPDYVNATIGIETELTPDALLAALHGVESAFGRARKERWGQRSLDLDLLALGDSVLPDRQTHAEWRELAPEMQIKAVPDRLVLPHPRLQDRAFVLVPLADIAPDWTHPVTGETVRVMLDRLPPADIDAIMPL